MGLRLAAVCALALGVATVSPAATADTLVAIDKSGSMKAYYQMGLIQRLADRLVRAASATGDNVDVGAFDVEFYQLDDTSQLRVGSQDTNLSKVLGQVVHRYQRIWLLTDNVQDVAGSHDMRDFYATLHGPDINHITVFPLRQEPGRAGLLIYALSTDRDASPLVRQVTAFRQPADDLNLSELVMKPLGENVIKVEPLTDNTALNFNEGERLLVETRVRIGPRFSHVYFDSSPARGREATSPFRGESCLVSEIGDTQIDPDQVETERAREYHIRVDFGRVKLRPTLGCLFTAAFARSTESGEIDTPLAVYVPRQNLRLSKAFLEEFAAESPDDATQTGKIFGFESVPQFLAPTTIEVPIRIPRQVTVHYPMWPGVVLILLGGLAVGLVFVGTRLTARLGALGPRVLAETESGAALLAEVRGDQVWVDKRLVGHRRGQMFSPVTGTRLDPEAQAAAISTPITCVIADGTRIRLVFGSSAKPAGHRPPGHLGRTQAPPTRLVRR